ncbi:SHOCT domain-containing protein, partial [Mycolicibacterium sp. CBMA 361]
MFWRFVNGAAVLAFVVAVPAGPILLFGYLLGAGSPWMLYVGLPVTAFVVLLVVGLVWANSGNKSNMAALEDRGIPALAQITGVTQQGAGGGTQGSFFFAVDLHIAGPGFDFDIHRPLLKVMALQLASFQARKLVVLVDPTTHDYKIDWQRSDLVNGVVPARFVIAEDNKTYDLTGQVGPLMEILQILRANNIAFDGTVDLDNPTVRQQVLPVIRRAAVQPAPTAQTAPVATASGLAAPVPTVAQRLTELETLHAGGMISDAEYTTRRQQIIA